MLNDHQTALDPATRIFDAGDRLAAQGVGERHARNKPNKTGAAIFFINVFG